MIKGKDDFTVGKIYDKIQYHERHSLFLQGIFTENESKAKTLQFEIMGDKI